MEIEVFINSDILIFNRSGNFKDSFYRIIVEVCVDIGFHEADFCCRVNRSITCLAFLCLDIKILSACAIKAFYEIRILGFFAG